MSGQGNDRNFGRPPHPNKTYPQPPANHPISYPPNMHGTLDWQKTPPPHLYHSHSVHPQYPLPHSLPPYPAPNMPLPNNAFYPPNQPYNFGSPKAHMYPPYPPQNPMYHSVAPFQGVPQDVHMALYSQQLPPGQFNLYHQYAQMNQHYPSNQPWPLPNAHPSFHPPANFQPNYPPKMSLPAPYMHPPPFSMPPFTDPSTQHSNLMAFDTSQQVSKELQQNSTLVSAPQFNRSQTPVPSGLAQGYSSLLPFAPSHTFPIEPTPKELDSCPPSPEKPTLLYKTIAQIGEGAYGKVYKALDLKTQKFVALKCLILEQEQEGLPYTALREIKLLQNLRSKYIVQLTEVLTVDKSIFMVFEYMDYDLEGFLAHPESNITHNHIRFLMRQILLGLSYLHNKGVVHRDLKGSNILLNKKGALKIADFGLARIFDQKRNQDYTNRVITLWYRPPELLLGSTNYYTEVDIWGAGCIMVEMFLRRTLFPGKDEIDQLDLIYKIMGTPNSESWPGIDDLPWYQLLLPKVIHPSQFSELYSRAIPSPAFKLIERMLSLNPKTRISASDALSSDYFKETDYSDCLSFPKIDGDWHEFEVKHRRREELLALRKARPVTPVSKGSMSPKRKSSLEVEKRIQGDPQKTNLTNHQPESEVQKNGHALAPDPNSHNSVPFNPSQDHHARENRKLHETSSNAGFSDPRRNRADTAHDSRPIKRGMPPSSSNSGFDHNRRDHLPSHSRSRRISISPRRRMRSPSPPPSRYSNFDHRSRSSRNSHSVRRETQSGSQYRMPGTDSRRDSRGPDRSRPGAYSRDPYVTSSSHNRSYGNSPPPKSNSSRNDYPDTKAGSVHATRNHQGSDSYHYRNTTDRKDSSQYYSSRGQPSGANLSSHRDTSSMSYRNRSRSRSYAHSSRRY